MNIFKAISAWWDSEFPSHAIIREEPVQSPPGKMKAPEPWPDPKEDLPVSCLVLGLIKSLETTSGEWMQDYVYYGRSCTSASSLKHKKNGFRVSAYGNDDTYVSSGQNLNVKEKKLLAQAYRNCLDNHQEQHRKGLIKTGHVFEKLGCPPKKKRVKKKV